MIRKLIQGILVSCAIVILPAVGRPLAVISPKLWVLVALGTLASFFQPVYNPFRRSATPEDRDTALQIIWSVILTQLMAVIEAVYFHNSGGLHWDLIAAAALVLMIAGLGLRNWAVFTLGQYFTWHITVQPGQQVIRNGPYRFMRHPGYTGGLLSYFFSTLFLQAWVSAVVASIVLPLAFLRRIRYEEALMRARFGEDYESYRREVGALIPWPKLARWQR